MSKLICPFCQQELDTGNYFVHCHNPHCNITVGMEGTEEMWEALIRTRKALDVAVDALGVISQITNQIDVCDTANDALNTITSLKQKDK